MTTPTPPATPEPDVPVAAASNGDAGTPASPTSAGEVTASGLSADQVTASRRAHGTNTLPNDTSRSLWAILRSNVFTLFNGIVLACFVLLFALGRWQDALFGFSAVANSIIGVWQESSAKRQLDRLRVLTAPRAMAVRDGAETDVTREDLVVGDLLVIRAGDQVPADAEVLSATGLQVDESLLTGESDAVDKKPGDELLSGAIVTAGHGYAVVRRIGLDSFAAKLTSEAKRFSLVNSEIRDGLNRVLRIVAWLLAPVMLIVVNGQMQAFGGWEHAFESGAWRDGAVGAVAAAIAMVPLGLLLMTSVAFAVGALKLSRRKVLVQELHAVEGLARVDVLCFDKTGTLTEGGVAFWAVHPADQPHPGWRQALGAFGADPGANESAKCLGEEFTDLDGGRIDGMIPFSSQRKWSALDIEGGAGQGTWLLGGPDVILDPARDADLLSEAGQLAEQGRRVIALCRVDHRLTEDEIDAETLPADRTGAALVTLRERIRPDAAETVRYFTEQGVDLRVISGDDPRTVSAVAREVGIVTTGGIDARTLPDDPDELADLMEQHRVFGRVTPTQKRSMVHALQARGRVVAMTGDGVNDVLALKDADLGIAMGHGSAAARAVSRLTLLDNQFEALPSVVDEGRQAIANVERVSMLYLSKTAYAILFAVVFGLMLWRYPFEPRQMSLLDGLTIGLPAFILALQPNPRRYLAGFFRRALWFAIPAGVIVAAGIVAVSIAAHLSGASLAQAQTAASIVLAATALWILSLVSRPIRPLLIGVLILNSALFVAALLIPLTTWFFGLALPDTPLLTTALIIAAIGCVALEVHGKLRSRAQRRELAELHRSLDERIATQAREN